MLNYILKQQKKGEKIVTESKGNKQKRVTNVVDIHPTISIIIFTVTNQKTEIVRVDQKHKPTMYCLQETGYFNHKDIYGLNVN